LLDPKVVNDLDYFEASHVGPYGEIKSLWRKIMGGIKYEITVPANSTATIPLLIDKNQTLELNGKKILPGKINLTAGVHTIMVKDDQNK
ncbi:MAG: alpha-L-rhamnosidase C-terminal domain-containing protein, partial [Bacteroidia bacterium]